MGIADRYDALVPTSMDQLINLADRISKSTLIPREYQGKPADCLLAMSMGLEIGLKPIQALQSIAVINNRTCLWGTAARALVMADPRLESLFETEPAVVDKTGVARCEIMRKGHADAFVGEFSLDNARKAQLTGKDNYSKYPGQMLTWRAFHMAARKAFPDIYKGLSAAEEMQEMVTTVTPGDNAGTVTLALDGPPSSDAQARAATSLEGVRGSAAPRRGRLPKTDEKPNSSSHQLQEPQAPTKAAEVTPLSPAVAATGPPNPTQPETCGFCHQPGHGFNECPQQRTPVGEEMLNVTGIEVPNGRTLNDEEQTEIMRMAKLLRPKSWMSWLTKVIGIYSVGTYNDLAEIPVDKMEALIKVMQANA